MIGLLILGALIVYLAIAIFVTVFVTRSMRARGLSRAKRWLAGTGTILVFYLIPFWDWIPTVLAHHYLCETQGVFQVRKTVEQWKSENQDVLPGLRYDRDAKSMKVGEFYRLPLNQRLASEQSYPVPFFLALKRKEGRIIDVKTGEVLAKYVDFVSGYGSFSVGGEGAWKFWLDTGGCSGELRGVGSFALTTREIQKIGDSK